MTKQSINLDVPSNNHFAPPSPHLCSKIAYTAEALCFQKISAFRKFLKNYICSISYAFDIYWPCADQSCVQLCDQGKSPPKRENGRAWGRWEGGPLGSHAPNTLMDNSDFQIISKNNAFFLLCKSFKQFLNITVSITKDTFIYL